MNKKEILFNLIENKKNEGCTILGVPSEKLKQCIISNSDVMNFFIQNGIEMPYDVDNEGVEHTFINVYAPQNSEVYAISISNKIEITSVLVEKIINTFFLEIIELYQFNILPYHVDIILNLNTNKIKFEDILMYLNRSMQQKEIAEKLNISQQFITDLKKGRRNMSIETLASFMKEYPLFFWYEYLKNIN